MLYSDPLYFSNGALSLFLLLPSRSERLCIKSLTVVLTIQIPHERRSVGASWHRKSSWISEPDISCFEKSHHFHCYEYFHLSFCFFFFVVAPDNCSACLPTHFGLAVISANNIDGVGFWCDYATFKFRFIVQASVSIKMYTVYCFPELGKWTM